MSVLAAKLGRALYHMLRKQEDFNEERFWNAGSRNAGSRHAQAKAASPGKAGVGCA